MSDAMKVLGVLVLLVAAIVGITVGGNALDFWQFSVYAPKQEQVRQNTFEQSQAYNDGMIRHLREIERQYKKADNDADRQVLAAQFRHEADGYQNRLPADLQAFSQSIN